MTTLDARATAALGDIAAELGTLRLDRDAGSATATVVEPLRELLETESVLTYNVRRRHAGWELAHWHAAGAITTNGTRARAEQLFATEPNDPVLYDPIRPTPALRNRVMEAIAWLEATAPGAWAASRLCREVFAPAGLEGHAQLRVLLCEGSVLVGWLGTIHPAAPTARQSEILAAVAPAMRRRLAIERDLARHAVVDSALAAAIEQLAVPAFVISAEAAIHEANARGHALLAAHRADVSAALADALAGRAHALTFELVPLAERGAPRAFLALLRHAPSAVRIAAAVGSAATAWQLTPRQRDVLALVVQGHANATIAALLGVSARTVELHVSALLDRVGVESRAALVTRVLA